VNYYWSLILISITNEGVPAVNYAEKSVSLVKIFFSPTPTAGIPPFAIKTQISDYLLIVHLHDLFEITNTGRERKVVENQTYEWKILGLYDLSHGNGTENSKY
jgi:hypothetical protein